jgi:NarL family two-component system response regulator LiaR
MQSAVVVDQWALLRLGITAVLRVCGVEVVGEEHTAADGLLRARATGADLVVLGTFVDLPQAEAARLVAELPHEPRIVALVTGPRREELRALMAARPAAVLVRTVAPEEMEDAIRRVDAGETVLAPALVPAMLEAMQGEEASAGEGPLTVKEQQVLARLAEGRSNQEIAEALFVTPATVKTHLAHIYAKLGVKGRHEALARALELGLLR